MDLKILLPVDGSTFCQAATRVAFQLASALPGSKLTALNIVNVRPPSGNVISDLTGYVGFEPAVVSPEVYQAHQQVAQGLVDTLVARAKTEGIDAEGVVATGAITAELVAASNRSDVVVMGVRGESEDRFPGQGGAQASNAMPQITVPVLLVPREITHIRSFAVGYDDSPSAVRALQIVGKLARPLNVPVHLIHVGDPTRGQERLEKAAQQLGADIHTVQHLVQGQEVHRALVDTAVSAKADVLVLGFQGQSKLKDVVFGSAQAHLLNKDLHVALLIAH
ncbi:MAG: universal stress protein [Myxococcota bacterium]